MSCPSQSQPSQKKLGQWKDGGKGEDTPPTGTSDEAVEERKLKGVSWAIVIVALLSSTFLYAFDNTVMANVRPSIIKAFNRIDMLPWLSVSYPMGEVGSNPLWGKLNKQFSNKKLYLSAVFIFEVGSAVIGSAQSVEIVVVGRALAGLGGCGIYVGTMNIMSTITTPMERTHYLNLVGVSWCLGTILGPVIGGAFADSAATWRWAFYINICIAAVAAPACIFLVPAMPPPTPGTVLERIRQVDIIGAVLFLGGVVSIVMILAFGGALFSWDDRRMIALYVVTVVVWAVFSLQQRFSFLTSDRIFPAQFVGNWEMMNLFSWTSIAISNLVVTVYSLPLLFQFTGGDSSLHSGAYTIPYVAAIIVSIGTTGPLFAKFPIYKTWFAGASVLMLVGNCLLSTISSTTAYGTVCGYSILGGLGVGPVVQLPYTVAQVKVEAASVPEVTAFLSCAQMAGLALSLGIATTVFLNGATNVIAAILPGLPRNVIMASIDTADTSIFQNLTSEVRFEIREAIAQNIGDVFYLNVAGAGFGIILALLMKREWLNLGAR